MASVPQGLRTLRVLPNVNPREIVTTRTWIFNKKNGMWTVNNQIFDLDRVDATVKRGTAERWIFRNESLNWHHPIHVHFEEFQILSRNGQRPPAQ